MRRHLQQRLLILVAQDSGTNQNRSFYTGKSHAWTLNVPLMLAAFVAGGVWSLQFYLHKRLPSVIVSHALWSVTIFLFLPVV